MPLAAGVVLTGHQLDELALACHAVRILDAGRLGPACSPEDLDAAALARHGIWDAAPGAAPGEESRSTALPPTALPPALRVRGLSVSRGGVRVLDGVDLDVGVGEHLALMGPNGVGKSSLLRALAGLLGRGSSDSGSIVAGSGDDGVSLEGLPAHRRSAHLGWVGQDPGAQLAAATVRQELQRCAPLPRHRRRERRALLRGRSELAASILDETGLEAFAETHPLDLDLARRKDLVIGTALLTRPEVLLLDEPTLGRDARAMARLKGMIVRVRERGGAVISTSHDARWVGQSADRMVRLG